MNKITVNKLPKSMAEMRVEIPAEDFSVFEEKALAAIAAETEIAGFRKGAAPKEMVKNKIGQEKISERAAGLAIDATFAPAAMQESLEPLGYPEVSILKLAQGNPFEYKAVVSLWPKAILPDYKKTAQGFSVPKIEITDEDIKRLKMEKERHARQHLRQDLLEALAKGAQVEIPEILIERETQNALAQLKERTPQVTGMPYDEYLKKIGQTEAQLKERLAQDSETKIKNYLVLQEIAQAEKIEVGEEEIEKALKNELSEGQTLPPEEEARAKDYWRQNLQSEKTFEKLESYFKS